MDTCERNDSIPLIITNNVCDNKWALYMANKLCRGLAIYAWNNAELLLHTISVIIILYGLSASCDLDLKTYNVTPDNPTF